MSSGLNISIPNVDPAIVQKLQNVVNSIDTTTGTMKTAGGGINSTTQSVNNAVSAIVAASHGQEIQALATIWGGTTKDGSKAHDALTSTIGQLTSLSSTINEHLPAIKTGIAAIQTAQADQQKSTPVDPNVVSQLQGQINGLVTALAAITLAAGSTSKGIDGISIGGVCSTGIQPGDPQPHFDKQSFNKDSGSSDTQGNNDGPTSNTGNGDSSGGSNNDGGNNGGSNNDGGNNGGNNNDGGNNGGSNNDGGNNGGNDNGNPGKGWRDPKAPWRSKFVTKLLVGYGIGAANNILPSLIAGHWLWGPFATGGAASTAAGFALSALPFPENAIAQTFIGQVVNIASYKFLSGGSSSPPNTPPGNIKTETLPNGAIQETQKLPDGTTQIVVTEPDGTSLMTMTSGNKTTQMLKKTDGTVEIEQITSTGTTLTVIDPSGKTSTTHLPPTVKPPVLLPTPLPKATPTPNATPTPKATATPGQSTIKPVPVPGPSPTH